MGWRKRNQIAVGAAHAAKGSAYAVSQDRRSWEDPTSPNASVAASEEDLAAFDDAHDADAIDVAPNFDLPALGDAYGTMVDSRFAELVCRRLRLSKSDVWTLRKVFNGVDVDGTNTITMAEFFFLIQETPCSLTKTILRLAGVPPKQTRLRFDEYLCCVCRFAAFSESELIGFVFAVYNTDRERGAMVGEDMETLVHGLLTMPESYTRNVRQATAAVTTAAADRHAVFSVNDLQHLARHNHVAFYPVLRVQRHVRAATLGERYWREKRAEEQQIDAMVQYMEANYGVEPPWRWQDVLLEVLWFPWHQSMPSKREQLRDHARHKYEVRMKKNEQLRDP